MDKSQKKLLWQMPFLLLLIVGTVYVIRQNKETPFQHTEGLIFGTVYHATYQSEEPLDSLLTDAFQQVDQALSMFNPQSTVSLINSNQPVTDNPMFMEVAELAMQVAKDTEGSFDPTVAPLVNLWGFGFKKEQTPTQTAIDSIRTFVGYQKLKVLPHCQVEKADPRISMDFSAIAKGYGCDAAARVLRQHGVDNYMVEIGGEVVVSGHSPKGDKWHIGISRPNDDPDGTSNEIQHILSITGKGIATSGNYRNFYYRDGKKYAHTIDPRTGQPVQHTILSATVVADRCARADAYSTAFMVMGLERAQQVLKRHADLQACFILSTPDGGTTTWMSDGLK